ncbi:MAG: carboxymuconolactone decarboxylase family protein [Pseudomonadales bacterium]|nr:carboxymuconolactone decarboxylase family protein [Pseudomonadales bacterium]
MSDIQPTPRVPMLSKEEAAKRAAELGLPKGFSGLSVFRLMLQHPVLAGKVANLLSMLLGEGNKLDARLRELIIMRIGWTRGSNYEWTAHWGVCMNLEIPAADVLAVQGDWKAYSAYSDADRAVLQATDDTLQNGAISSSTWEELNKVLTTAEERIEIVIAIANWNMFSQLLLSLQVPLEEGKTSWPPEGEVPPAAQNPVHLDL